MDDVRGARAGAMAAAGNRRIVPRAAISCALAVGLGMGLGIGLGACGKEGAQLGISDTDPRWIVGNYALPDAAQTALLEGTLTVGPGNCLTVLDPEGRVHAPVFPRTTRVLGGGEAGIEIEGRRFPLGARVSFGGGSATLVDNDRQAVAPCSNENELFYIQSLGD